MGNAYESHLATISMTNVATTTIPQFKYCRLCTTLENVDLITTVGLKPFGITQEAINPGDTGRIAVRGASMLRMCSSAYTSLIQPTSTVRVGATANGSGRVLTTTTLWVMGQADHANTYAASDIITVWLHAPTRRDP